MKRVLMIAFHYPPSQISSGIQRTLKFTAYLRDHDWEPAVISAHPRAYPRTSDDQIGDIPEDMRVVRAFALDTSRHLAVAGRFPLLLSLPDRWSTWTIGGIASGLKLIRQWRPDVIWSTYPLATAHQIAFALHRLTNVPWVADFRDSMTEDNYPSLPARRRSYLRIERAAVRHASRLVFTTPGAARMYAERYPDTPAAKWAVIANGFDENNFRDAETGAIAHHDDERTTLVHSGLLYPKERDPTAFFDAIAELAAEGTVSQKNLSVRLRATGHDAHYEKMLDSRGIADIVSLDPPVGYREALTEMLNADGLLLFQSASCNHQIPAKLYEYLRARRPVFALTDKAGDTAAELRNAGIDTIVALDDKEHIKRGLADFLLKLGAGGAPVADNRYVEQLSRRARTAELARLLNEVTAA